MSKNTNQKPSRDAKSRVLEIWQPGMVLTSSFLLANGISAKQAYHLKRTGILESLGVGAYKKARDHVTWPSICSALESQLKLPIHVGGKSALTLRGHIQYLELGRFTVGLFLSSVKPLPNWFTKKTWDFDWYLCNLNLFSKTMQNSFLNDLEIQNFDIRTATRERAILEMIYLIGKKHRFEEVEEIFEGLINLDPKTLQTLLENCNSIKTNRVFLYLAQKYEHPWQADINEAKINLGSGKREVVKGGSLNQRYQITVPKEEETLDV